MDLANRLRSDFIHFLSALLVIAALYLGRELLIPLALAALFTFLLNPLVKLLCRLRLPRAAGVVAATLLCFSTLALVAWLLGGELANLANELPDHRQNIHKRVESLQQLGDSQILQRLRKLVGDVQQSAEGGAAPSTPAPPAPPPAEADSGVMKVLNMLVPTLANALGTASVVILFVFFMLMRLQEINQRVVQLIGYSRLTLTTRAVDEAGERISRYLLMQVTVNSLYGILLGIGLALMGLPYVVLWGALAAMFRFMPYVGPWLVAVLPISLSLAVFEGWTLPLMVTGFIVLLELLTNMVLEPLLYGHSAGVADFALLLAIAFWTWLWGGVGLVLATPLTVCIVVFCKHIPRLAWVDIAMGENPTTQPHLKYYQHNLANDEEACQVLLDASVKKEGMVKTVEEVIMPAVALTRLDELSGQLTPEEAAQMYQGIRASFTFASESGTAPGDVDATTSATPDPEPATTPEPQNRTPVRIVGRALQGEADRLALDMLEALTGPHTEWEKSIGPVLTGELVHLVEEQKPAALCISAMPPQAQASAGVLCRRLRSRLPDLKILVCRWDLPGQKSTPKPLLAAGATWVTSSIAEAQEILAGLADRTSSP